MIGSPKLWRLAAGAFVLINLGGAAIAIAMGEPMHTVWHAILLLAGYLVWRVVPWGRRQDLPVAQPAIAPEKLEYLQQSVDAIALEVERIGEAQRFSEKVRAKEDGTAPPKDQQR
jgi:hypothetical protein